MPTFVEWLTYLEGDLSHNLMWVNMGFTSELTASQIVEAIAKVEFAKGLYDLYIEDTQIEELADLEGVGA